MDGGKAGVCKELRSTVQDAHTALTDLRSRNAEQAFSQALVLLETSSPKVIIDLQTRNKTVALNTLLLFGVTSHKITNTLTDHSELT